jgi:hypothetical protein
MRFHIFLLLITVILESIYGLKVITVLPGPQKAGDDFVYLAYRDAITVIYDEPVIKLGQDWGSSLPEEIVPFHLNGVNVPGKIRYVTTSIARFDPDINWPNDLNFTVVLHSITGLKGDVLENPTLSYSYYTDAVNFDIWSIESKRANELTDNNWSYYIPSLQEDGTTNWLFEVPPDAKITLGFTHEIDIDVIGTNLILKDNNESVVPFTYGPCDPIDSYCIAITPELTAIPDIEYTLTLPEGIKISTYSGFTEFETTLSFSGLFGFRFPLFWTRKPSE